MQIEVRVVMTDGEVWSHLVDTSILGHKEVSALREVTSADVVRVIEMSDHGLIEVQEEDEIHLYNERHVRRMTFQVAKDGYRKQVAAEAEQVVVDDLAQIEVHQPTAQPLRSKETTLMIHAAPHSL